jgi:hypothetical protein
MGNSKIFLQEIPTMSPKSLNPHVKLPHSVIVKSTGLLPMFYTVHELVEEIAIPERTLCDWLSHGAPHTRDRLSHIWIDGRSFASWVESLPKKSNGARLKNDEGYCLSCKRAVDMLNPILYPSASRVIYIHGTCPVCNGKITQGTWVFHLDNNILVGLFSKN